MTKYTCTQLEIKKTYVEASFSWLIRRNVSCRAMRLSSFVSSSSSRTSSLCVNVAANASSLFVEFGDARYSSCRFGSTEGNISIV